MERGAEPTRSSPAPEERAANSATDTDAGAGDGRFAGLRRDLPLLVVCLLLLVFLYRPGLNSDGSYYYEFIRSYVFDGDLQFLNEREFFSYRYVPVGVMEKPPPGDFIDRGYTHNIFSLGPPLSWSVPYGLVHLGARVLAAAGAVGPLTGYELGYRSVVGFSSVLQVLLGLLLLTPWLASHYGHREARLVTPLLLVASNLVAFMVITPAFSHALSFLCTVIFLYVWDRSRPDWSWWRFAAWGALCGWLLMARWQNAFLGILPLADLVHGLLRRRGARPRLDLLGRYALMGFIAFLVAVPQFTATAILYGKPLTDPQGRGGMHWLTPWFRTVLFDGNHGLFRVNPIYLVGYLALPLVWKRDRRLAAGLLAALISQSWINAVRRDPFGVGFGMRRFINTLPMVAFGLAALLALLRRRPRLRTAAVGFLTLLAPWNLLLMAQYYLSELGAPWHTVPPALIRRRQFTLAPRLLLELVRGSTLGKMIGMPGFGGIGPLLSVLALVALVLLLVAALPRLERLSAGRGDRLLAAGVLGAVLFSLAAAAALAHSDARTVLLRTIELRSPEKLGSVDRLRQRADRPYAGRASGLVFEGADIRFVRLRAEYDRNRFLALGRYRREEAFFLRRRDEWAVITLREPTPAGALQLVTAVEATTPLPAGAPLLTLEIEGRDAAGRPCSERLTLHYGKDSGPLHLEQAGELPPARPAVTFRDPEGRLARLYSATQRPKRCTTIARLRVRSELPAATVHLNGIALTPP
jgi:hypothetical protein